METFTPTRIFITGSTGFVGSYLIEACRQRYPTCAIVGYARQTPLPPIPDDATTHTIYGDILDAVALRAALADAQPDLVVHLAAQASVASSWRDPAGSLTINALGTVTLFESLLSLHLAPRVILVSSSEIYGSVLPEANPIPETAPLRPNNPYAVTKATQDLYGLQYYLATGLPIMRARPFNHFGPRQSDAFVIASFAHQIAQIERGEREPILTVGNLQVRRDFLPVRDVALAYLALAESGHAGEAYNIGSGQSLAIAYILEHLLAMSTVPIQVTIDPARIRPVDVPDIVANTQHIQRDTGWRPVMDLEMALRETLDYWRANSQ